MTIPVDEQAENELARRDGYCEDYPCCGHTDGLGCNYTPDYGYINKHAGCDHEIGDCWVNDIEEDEDDDEDY